MIKLSCVFDLPNVLVQCPFRFELDMLYKKYSNFNLHTLINSDSKTWKMLVIRIPFRNPWSEPWEIQTRSNIEWKIIKMSSKCPDTKSTMRLNVSCRLLHVTELKLINACRI